MNNKALLHSFLDLPLETVKMQWAFPSGASCGLEMGETDVEAARDLPISLT